MKKKNLTKQKDLLRVSQVMEMLGLSHQHVDTIRKKGVIRSIQFVPGGDHRYIREDVEKLLEIK